MIPLIYLNTMTKHTTKIFYIQNFNEVIESPHNFSKENQVLKAYLLSNKNKIFISKSGAVYSGSLFSLKFYLSKDKLRLKEKQQIIANNNSKILFEVF